MSAVTSGAPAAAETQQLKRDFSLWSAFSIAFAVVSPIIGVYSVLGLSLLSGGPGSWWGFLFVMICAVLIAAVLGQLASRWPYEGSIYQWARRLGGPRYGWFAGWTYFCTYVIASATLAYGAVTFLAPALGVQPFGKGVSLLLALGVLVLGTLANTTARRWLKALVVASMVAEAIGSVGLGTVLMFFHHEQPVSILVNYGGHGLTGGFGWGGMLTALAFLGWVYNGFDSAAAMGEEVKDAQRAIPKAIIAVIVIIAAVAMYSSAAIILAIPDVGAVLSGKYDDPVVFTVTHALGSGFGHVLFAGFTISFFAGLTAAQTAVSRVVWAFARDGVVPGARGLVALAGKDLLPVRAILLVSAVIGLLLLVGLSDNVFATLITFTTGGFFIAFSLAVGGYLVHKLTGRWQPGPFTLGRWQVPVAVLAMAWCVGEYVNVAWPRGGLPWFEQWGVLMMTVLASAVGYVIYRSVHTQVSEWRHAPAEEPSAQVAGQPG